VSRLTILIYAGPPGRADQQLDEQLETSLLSALENRPDDCEILVAHDGRYSDPYDLADEVTFVTPQRGRRPIDAIRTAVQTAQGEVIHTLAAGATVEPDWVEPALLCFDQPNVASVAPLALRPADENQAPRVATAGLRYSSGGAVRHTLAGATWNEEKPREPKIIGPALAAGFYRREWLLRLDAPTRRLGLTVADADIALSLGALGQAAILEPRCRVTLPAPAPSRGLADALARERLFWRHAKSRGMLRSLLMHPGHVLADIMRQVSSPAALGAFAGRVLGMLDISGTGRSAARLREIAAELECESPASLPLDADGGGQEAAPSLRRAG